MKSTKHIRLILLITLLAGSVYKLYFGPTDSWGLKAALETPDRMAALQTVENTVKGWPPQVGVTFPDLNLTDHNGAPFRISSLKGKPVIVEIIAMSCAGCQAFSGGNKYGGYGGFPAQEGLGSIEQYLKSHGRGVDLFGDKLNFVQIIIYNLSLKPPTVPELAAWRKHFNLDKPNTYIVSGGEPLASKASYNMIPGFLLLDRDLNVKFDCTGHNPKHNLFTQLLPAVSGLLK